MTVSLHHKTLGEKVMRYLSLTVLAIALTGCVPDTSTTPIPGTNNAPNSSTTKPMDSTTAPAANSSTTTSGTTDPNNTGVNVRDRDAATKTPIDQDENSTDVKITADIRKQILATEGMSVNARNSKIITSQGKVTLRGPVENDEEKAKIEKIAQGVAGAGNVTSELEVKN
jgi:hyperosmotically inducible protein